MTIQIPGRPTESEGRKALVALYRRAFESTEERDWLLQAVVEADDLPPKDLVWMLFRPDRAIREAGVTKLRGTPAEAVVPSFLGLCHQTPEAGLRGAALGLFSLESPGLESALTRAHREGDDRVRTAVLAATLAVQPSPEVRPLYWELLDSIEEARRVPLLDRLAALPMDDSDFDRWQALAEDDDEAVRDLALTTLAAQAPDRALPTLLAALPLVGYGVQQVLVEAIGREVERNEAEFADQVLPLMASGEAGIRSAVLKILLRLDDRRDVVRRYLLFSKGLAGWIRDRALDSMREFGEALVEPTIALLAEEDESLRGTAVLVAGTFEDPRVVPAIIPLLEDPDWWVRITAAESLGRLGDVRAVEPLCRSLLDTEARWAAAEALGRIGDPAALQPLARLLQDPAVEVRIEALLALRRFRHPKILEVMRRVASDDPDRVVRGRALELAEEVARRDAKPFEDHDEVAGRALHLEAGDDEPPLHRMLIATRERGASDLHVSVAQPPLMRRRGDLVPLGDRVLTRPETEQLLLQILSDEQRRRLRDEHQVDLCYWIPRAGRYRANLFQDQKGLNAVFRVIAEKPPTTAEIGLPDAVNDIASHHQGLVLVCGPAGSGKTTTLAALVNLFNETRHDHVITLEDPVEFVHPFKNCLINQREVGAHTKSFARALRAALREDPDVIVIGDLRDVESMGLALTAAETGHIVFATLNSVNAVKAVDRVISAFPAGRQAQTRAALADSLRFVVAQRLIIGADGERLACFEVLRGVLSVANLIRDGKTYQLPSCLQVGRSQGMQTFDDALRQHLRYKRVTPEIAYRAAENKEDFREFVSAEFLESTEVA
jgi:twitching motility protein PilT